MLDDTAIPPPIECAAELLTAARPVLEKIADKWSVLILTSVSARPMRFNELRRNLGDITHKALSDALKRLERNGLLTRTVLPTAPVGVQYAITPLGRSLSLPFQSVLQWALNARPEMEQAAARYDAGH